MPQRPHGPLRSYGRTTARSLKPAQAEALATRLPPLQIDVASGPVDLCALKPDAAEVWLEIGFGAGEHMVEQAARRPDVLMLGAEPFRNGVASALAHISARDLANVRLHPGDARDLVSALPDAGLDRVFVLFPDPWPKARHHKRRLIQPDLVGDLARALKPGGRLRFATDWRDYADEALLRLTGEPRLAWTAERADDWRRPPADHAPTRYQAKRLGDIAPVFFDLVRLAPAPDGAARLSAPPPG